MIMKQLVLFFALALLAVSCSHQLSDYEKQKLDRLNSEVAEMNGQIKRDSTALKTRLSSYEAFMDHDKNQTMGRIYETDTTGSWEVYHSAKETVNLRMTSNMKSVQQKQDTVTSIKDGTYKY
jgi:hypothetical protein